MDIILLNSENFFAFENMIPEEYLEGNILALGAVEENEAMGCLVAQDLGEAFNLAFVHVDIPHRQKGAATMLIKGLLEIRDESFEGKPVIAMYPESIESEAIVTSLLLREGFEIEIEKNLIYKLDKEQIYSSPIAKEKAAEKYDGNCKTLREIDDDERENLIKAMADWADNQTFDETMLEDLDETYSLVAYEGNAPIAAVLIGRESKGKIEIAYLSANARFTAKVIPFMKYAFSNIIANDKYLTSLSFACTDEKLSEAAKQFFGKSITPTTVNICNAVLF